ncbi:hypothetical protein ACH4TV_24680 [Streptomyces sp. NPDC020898]|uniref:hypothetical protein n=1 Tax=Streptomyces sp. NPDC020898 TaxID=3365101 RepID=UPI0037B7C029
MPAVFLFLADDQPYVPQPRDNGHGVVEFLTSAQTVLGLVVALIALTLLLSSLWPGRRRARDGKEGGKRS